MTREILVQVAGLDTAAAVWASVTEMFSSVSKGRIVQLRTQLAQTRKENMTGKAYFGRIKALADEMANAGKKLDDEDIISYILAGLDDQYDGFVASINALLKAEKHVSLGDLYSMFVPYEARLEGRNPGNSANGGTLDLSINAASHGGYGNNRGGGFGNRGGRGGGHGNFNNGGGGRGGGSQNHNSGGNFNSQGGNGQYQQRQGGGGRGQGRGSGVICQICEKEGHPAFRCWKSFHKTYKTLQERR